MQFALALAAICLASRAQEATATFTVALAAKQTTVHAGSEIRLSALLTNVSNHVIWVDVDKYRAAELEGYLVEVRDGQGRIQRTSRYYWSLGQLGGGRVPPWVPSGTEQDYSGGPYEGSGEGSWLRINLQPGETNEALVDVGKLYAPLEPGKYSVQVQRVDKESKVAVKSNVVTLEVTK
jgi:hypothetical protein